MTRSPSWARVAQMMILGLAFGLLAQRSAHAAPTDLEDWERHIRYLQRQAAQEPGLPNVYLRLADAYSQIGDSERVEQYCRAAQDRGAHPVRIYALLGEHYLRVGRFEQALANLLRAQELGPRSAATHILLWRTLLAMRQAPGGAAAVNRVQLRQALGVLSARGYYVPLPLRQTGTSSPANPKVAQGYLAQGYAAIQSQNLQQALASFQAAADAQPTLADAFRGMGIVLARLRQTERAFAAYHLFLELAPEPTAEVRAVEQIILQFYQRRRGPA